MTQKNALPDYRQLFDLTGKVAVVTGGAGILGRHFCSGLASHGADTVVVDLEADRAQTLADQLHQQFGVRSLGVACDVARPEEVDSMAARIADHFGHVDVLHNNAGARIDERYFSPAEEYPEDVWRHIMSVNIDGVFWVARAIGRLMIQQGRGGSVIQTASIYGVVAPDKRIYEGSEYRGWSINTPPVYSASKAAVVGLTRYLAAHWGEHRIRVNTLTPGGVESGQNETFQQRYGARIPLGRMARAHEMVGAVVWLASDASTYVTGQNIIVDGGLTAW